MSARTVYATVQNPAGADVRLSGTLETGGSQVLVGIAHGGMIGLYNLDRFEGGKLTAGTLARLFTPA